MKILIPIIALGTVTALTINAGRKQFGWIKSLLGGISPVLFGIIYGVFAVTVLSLFVLSRIPNNGVPRVIFLIDHYLLGVLVYIILFVNTAAFVVFLGKCLHLLPEMLSKNTSAAIGIFTLLLSVGLSVYGSVHAQRVQTKQYEVRLGSSTDSTDSMKIALISDLHLGYAVEEAHLQKIVRAVNEMEPDVICIAGDIFDGDITSLNNPDTLKTLFRQLHAPDGVYACLGNHDAGPGYEQMLSFLADADVQVLQDDKAVIDGKILLAGRKDSSPIGGQGEKRQALELSQEELELPVIVLDHQPGNHNEYDENTDLVLSGHTHQGQMFPFNLITKAMPTVDYGYYKSNQSKTQAIVTSGAGTWGPPMRVGTNSEAVLIDIKFPAKVK